MHFPKKRLLYLARSFPPVANIAAVRSKNLAKYLAHCGWDIQVVTVDPALVAPAYVAPDSYSLVDDQKVSRILTGYHARYLSGGFIRSNLQKRAPLVTKALSRLARAISVDEGIGWKIAINKACRNLEPHSVDLVLATAPPYAALIAAEGIAERLRCPFVLDYRDSWSIGPHKRDTFMSSWFKNRERRLLSKAATVLTVSWSMATAMSALFSLDGKATVITNGFDPEEADNVNPMKFDHSAIVYAGTFYPPKRVLDPFMACLKILKSHSLPGPRRFCFHYFGPDSNHVMETAGKHDVVDMVVNHGLVHRQQVLSAIKGALAAVVITSIEPSGSVWDNGVITGKIFEPLAMQTPILLIAPRGNDARFIVESTESGRCFTGEEVEAMAAYLMALFSGEVTPTFRGAEAYAWPAIAAKLDTALTRCIIKR